VWWCTPVTPATQEAEVGRFLELMSLRLARAMQQNCVLKKIKGRCHLFIFIIIKCVLN
jgi:hypothetical protein